MGELHGGPAAARTARSACVSRWPSAAIACAEGGECGLGAVVVAQQAVGCERGRGTGQRSRPGGVGVAQVEPPVVGDVEGPGVRLRGVDELCQVAGLLCLGDVLLPSAPRSR